MRIVLALALALAASGCHSPPPFDAQTDCPKLAVCGQCASRGGCAWCGDTEKGQCLAVGHAECAAPGGWSKTPDHCPAPPKEPLVTVTPAPAGPSAMQRIVGAKRYAEVKSGLARAFPNATVSDAAVDGVIEVMLRERVHGPETREAAPLSRVVHERDHRLYMGYATHHRVKAVPPGSAAMQSKFTLPLPMVRVTLPDKLDAANTMITTELGDVDLSRDHLLGSIDLVNAKYGGKEYLGGRPERVDLITPARAGGSRFGAMAVYLGYRRKADRGPSFYMLEAGTATGDARMIYFSPSMAPIQRVTSYYLPTPFVTMSNTYAGGLTMKAAPSEDEPEELLVKSYSPGETDPYITVTLRYQRAPKIDLPLPVEITADAGARVALIAKTMGVASAVDLQNALADLAKTLHWQEYPRYVVPSGPAAPTGAAAPATAAPAATGAPPR